MSDNNNIVVLTEVLTKSEAIDMIDYFSEEGISAEYLQTKASGFIDDSGDVQILVKQVDYDKAQVLLKKYDEACKNIDWDNVDLGEFEG
jgi:excinuclease UvrABC helicase subunit UvrB